MLDLSTKNQAFRLLLSSLFAEGKEGSPGVQQYACLFLVPYALASTGNLCLA
jgi:hypothetical protein